MKSPTHSTSSSRTDALLQHLCPFAHVATTSSSSAPDSHVDTSPTNGSAAATTITIPPPIPSWVAETIPGPWELSHPQFGHGRHVRKWMVEGKNHLMLKKWRQDYGPIFGYIVYEPALNSAGLRVVIDDPHEARRVLKLNPVKPPGYQTSVILGEGVLSNTDPVEWARQRELLKPAFTNSALKELMPVMIESATELLAHLRDESKAAESVDIHEMLSAYAFLIIGHSALGGQEGEFLTRRAVKLRAAFDVVTFKEIQRINIEKDEDYRMAKEEINNFTTEALGRFEENAKACPAKHKDTLLNIVTSKDKTGCPHMSARLRADELSTFMFAGHETTAHTMSWAIMELARHPNFQQKLQKEIDAHLAVCGGFEKLEYKDLFKFEFLTLVVNETLRLWPVVANGTFRLLEEDLVILGHKVPKNTIISFPHILLHHDKAVWGEDAETFNPERKWFPDSFTPFTVSPRDCLGRNLAMMEMRISLIGIFHKFNVRLTKPNAVYQGFNTFTLFPEHGVWVNLEQRN